MAGLDKGKKVEKSWLRSEASAALPCVLARAAQEFVFSSPLAPETAPLPKPHTVVAFVVNSEASSGQFAEKAVSYLWQLQDDDSTHILAAKIPVVGRIPFPDFIDTPRSPGGPWQVQGQLRGRPQICMQLTGGSWPRS